MPHLLKIPFLKLSNNRTKKNSNPLLKAGVGSYLLSLPYYSSWIWYKQDLWEMCVTSFRLPFNCVQKQNFWILYFFNLNSWPAVKSCVSCPFSCSWVFIHEKAYQVTDTGIESSLMTKVKGFGYHQDQVMDVADYVLPPQVCDPDNAQTDIKHDL